MNSKLFLLNARDYAKGAALAVITAVVSWAYDSLQTGTFALTADTGYRALNIALIAFVGYILKNLLSDEDGKVLGRIG